MATKKRLKIRDKQGNLVDFDISSASVTIDAEGKSLDMKLSELVEAIADCIKSVTYNGEPKTPDQAGHIVIRQEQPNWNESNAQHPSYIQGKPNSVVNEILYDQQTRMVKQRRNDSVEEVFTIPEGGTTEAPDTEMSDSSENTVQNKVIKAYVDAVSQRINILIGSGNVQGAIDTFIEVVAFLEGINSSDTLAAKLLLKQDALVAGNGIVIAQDGKTVSVDAEVVQPVIADGTFAIRIGNNTYIINLNHTHPQYLTAQSLKEGSNVSISVNQQTGEVTIKAAGSGTSYDDTEVRQLISNLNTALQTLNKSLAAVATSGSYNDLSNKPTIPDVTNLATKAEIANIGKIVNVNGGDVKRVWVGTQAEYDAIEDLDDDVVYLQALAYRPKVVLDLYDASVPQNTPTNVDIGSSFSVTVTPKAGFSFARISGTMAGGTLAKTENQDGSVTFDTSSVTGRITISASATTAKIANAGGKLSVMAAKTFADDPSNNTDSGGQGNIGVFTPQGSDKWDVRPGLLFDGYLQAYDAYNGGSEDVSTLLNWPRGYYRRHINANGEIINSYAAYAASNGRADHVAPGYHLFHMLELDPNNSSNNYDALATILHEQLANYQGKLDYGTTHPYTQLKANAHQTILEVTHSIEPFAAMYAKEKMSGSAQTTEYEHIIARILEVGNATYDSTTKLYRHGYAETGSGVVWAENGATGRSHYTFGRALGQYIWAIEQVLDIIPSTVTGWNTLKGKLQDLMNDLLTVDGRDRTTGLWRMMPTRGATGDDAGNYLESASSALFVYGYLHGIRMGYLDESNKATAKHIYESIAQQFVTIATDTNGTSVTVTGSVKAGRVGTSSTTDAASSLAYYYSNGAPAQSGEVYGTAAFILASVEYERMFLNE